MQNQLVERKEAMAALQKGKVVHLFNTKEPHLTEPSDGVCWCEPEVNQYDSGGVLITHREVSWQ